MWFTVNFATGVRQIILNMYHVSGECDDHLDADDGKWSHWMCICVGKETSIAY